MAKYDVPAKAEDRMKDLNENITVFQTEYKEFKEKTKKACGYRAKKALTTVKKLITTIRRDIADEIKNSKKEEPKAEAATETKTE